MDDHHRLDALILPHYDRLEAIRKDLHRHPELANEEVRTSATVCEVLRDLGLNPKTVASTGVVVDIGNGPAVALRADLDALPIHEQNSFEHRSARPGVMHGCGHDGHTTILLGVAAALASSKDRLARCGRSVRLLFQPAEEGGGGAQRMIEEGALDGVDAVFGLHNWPITQLGKVGVKPGAMMAASALVEVSVKGCGGHASQPHNATDPVIATAHIIGHLQTLVSRETDPREAAVVSICTVHGGLAPNVIPDHVDLTGTIRAFDDGQLDDLGLRLEAMVTSLAEASRCRATCNVQKQYPSLVNHEAEAKLVAEISEEIFGRHSVTIDGLPALGAEDFSYYLQARRGAFFFLGSHRPGTEIVPIHSSSYDFNDELILPGVRMFLRLIERSHGCSLL